MVFVFVFKASKAGGHELSIRLQSTTATKRKDKMQRRTTFKVIFRGRLVVRPFSFHQHSCQLAVQKKRREEGCDDVHLLSAEDQSLLDRGDAFFLLDALLYSGHLDGF